MKYTRNCLFPWQFIIIHAGGLMCPCCTMNDADYGDFILDYVEPKKQGKELGDVFNNQAIQDIKKGLLSGDLRPMCQNCALLEQRLIPIEQFKKNVWSYLIMRGHYQTVEDVDLSKVYAYERAGIGLTNRCNLRCIYCNQSVLADKNPYFKVDFPNDAMLDSLELLVENGVDIIETGAFGEATIHPQWYSIFSEFHKRHPEVKLFLTTNLCKRYSDDEIRLLASHSHLRISLETLDEELFERIRVNGNLKLLLENIERINDMIQDEGLMKQHIAIDSVICNLTWKEIPDVSEFAYANGYAYGANNYEKRPNSIGYISGELRMVEELQETEKEDIRQMLLTALEKAQKLGLSFSTNGNIIGRVEKDYHKFTEVFGHPIYEAVIKQFPVGDKEIHLGCTYDFSNNSYAGIYMERGRKIRLEGLKQKGCIVREIAVYREGKCSPKYDQKVLPGYRKKIEFMQGTFEYEPEFPNEDVLAILLDINNFY